MKILEQLASVTDYEAEACLNGVLKGLSVTNPTFNQLLSSPGDIQEALRLASVEAGTEILKMDEPLTGQKAKAIRIILVEIAKTPELSPRLENWLETARPKLLEPVTTSLVLAGIILILSTHVTVEYNDANGKKTLKVKVEKKPTAAKILMKFFKLF